MKNFSKLLLSGSSISAGTSDLAEAKANPKVWPHFLLSYLDTKIFCNLSMPGGGNIASSKNIIYTLENKSVFNNQDTLIMFNISPLSRFDVMCAVDHPNANRYFSWANDLGFNWIINPFGARTLPFKGIIEKNMGIDALVQYNLLSIVELFNYLQQQQYDFYFLIDSESVLQDSTEYFKDNLKRLKDRWITFGNYFTVREYCKAHGYLDDPEHPSIEGHRQIAEFVKTHLQS